ncbi:DUF3021 domain-containing protein [Bacillus cereus]|uniref:DUF3021 domain-containing protein n=1 Tax=Bacillus cereus TaxID=1396 RepID=UPI000BED4282|nr:DUF3021 domain-containing protein [Bacillus cereus]PDY77421.1 hypothetical protein CON06_26885 [Bacillus cereus]PFA03362.1 hypothetical protein CN382_29340 [Bacillus cereus]
MKLKNRLYSGLGIGSLVYMIVLLSKNNTIFITQAEIISVLIISACAGILTFVFDIERISYLFALVIHFFMMFLVVYCISVYNHWIEIFPTADFLGGVFLIYVFSWLISFLNTKKDAKELNMLLKNKKNI